MATPPHVAPLQSRFPTKTVIALLLIGGLIYWATDVVEVLDLYDDSFLHQLEHAQQPLDRRPFHYYENSAQLDLALDTAKAILFDQWGIYDQLATRYGGLDQKAAMEGLETAMMGPWELEEEEAREAGMPVTHGARLISNNPVEDYYSFGVSRGPGSRPWNYWGIYDGHVGPLTSTTLQLALIPYVSKALDFLPLSSSPWEIERAIRSSFLRLDDDIMRTALNTVRDRPAAHSIAFEEIGRAMHGSCALLSMYDPASSKLRVACVGDSRAVLGRWDPVEEKYTCIPLSEDQTGFNHAEVKRLQAEHPDEPDILDPTSGRLLGMAVTRAFGNHRWKWTDDAIKALQAKFFGPPPRPHSATPPYMTAEPEVQEIDVVSTTAAERRARGVRSDFLIMASDGLWDRMSSEHAVECVQRWLEARERGGGAVSNDPQLPRDSYLQKSGGADTLEPGVTCDVQAGRALEWQATPEYFAIEDDNAAMCLVRNVLGGTRRTLSIGLLTMDPSMRRSAVDDTTVMVVFFDKLEPAEGAKEDKKKKTILGRLRKE